MPLPRRATIGAWIRPLFVGTTLGGLAFAVASASLHTLPSWIAWVPWLGALQWLAWIGVSLVVAFVQAVALGIVDVVLLRAKVRELPTGLRAYALSFASPIAVGVVLRAWPSLGLDLGAWAATTLAAIVAVSLLVRVLFGTRIDA